MTLDWKKSPWLRHLQMQVDAQESLWLPRPDRQLSPREFAVHALRFEAHRLKRRQLSDSPWRLALRSFAWPMLLPIKAWMHSRGSPRRLRVAWQYARDLLFHNIRSGALNVIRAQRGHIKYLPRLFVSDLENQTLTSHLYQSGPTRNIGNKSEFTRFCAEQTLPTLPVLSEGHGGHIKYTAIKPEYDLFIKPAGLYGGKGAAILHHDVGLEGWRSTDNEPVTLDNLCAWTAQHYADMDWIIQPRLSPPQDWAHWSPGALGTVRVTTLIVDPESPPEPVVCFMRFPTKGMIVDNLASGGLFADIDPATGIMHHAIGRPPRPRSYEFHPNTRHRILGEKVPHWEAVLELAIRAHMSAPNLVSVAWDVVLVGVRPILLEANPVWNLNAATLLGETRWVEAMCNRLARHPASLFRKPQVI